MKNRMIALLTVALLALSLGSALAEDKAPAAPADKAAPAEKTTTKRTKVTKERVVTATAVVQAINLEKRIVTLKGPKGKVFDITAGEEVRNLPQVKVGDEVVVKYYESVAYRLLKADEASVPSSEAVVGERAKKGDKPAAAAGVQTTVTVTIDSVDKKAQTVTFTGPQGNTATVKAQDPKNIENLKTGDRVVITYTEAVAIAVEAKKK